MACGTFTTQHLLTLLVLAVGIFFLVRAYCRCDAARRRIIRLVIGWSVIMMEVVRQVAYILRDQYQPSILPLHLCAIATFCVFIDSVKPNSWTREFAYALGTWGPACAITFPDWTNLPLFNIYLWQAFLIHSCLLAYALMLLVSGDLVPCAKRLWKVVVIMVGCVIVAEIVNRIWGTNFWYLNIGSPGSPLEPIQSFAGAFYLPVLAILVAILWTLMYLPWALAARRRKRPSSVG